MKNLKPILVFLACSIYAPSYAQESLSVPAGFTIEKLSFSVPNARQMALSDNGTLVVGTRRKGVVYAVPNALTDNPGEPIELLDDLRMPSGVTIHDGDLYVAATHEVLKVANLDQNLVDPSVVTIKDDLPKKRHHGWKYIKFGADGQLYVPVGAPCNICLSDDERFATLLTMNPQTGATQVFAHGLRNTVGFAWHPTTGDLWISDNGRDMLGDDVPPEEINVATQAGQHFGYPFVHGVAIKDPKFGDHKEAASHTFTPPTVNIQAHSAALGMDFYAAKQFPDAYQGALFIAEHGSWNRSKKVGYQVSVVRFEQGNPIYEPFVQGWLVDQDNWGRPNDVMVTPDGSLLISDDQGGVIWRVRYQP